MAIVWSHCSGVVRCPGLSSSEPTQCATPSIFPRESIAAAKQADTSSPLVASQVAYNAPSSSASCSVRSGSLPTKNNESPFAAKERLNADPDFNLVILDLSMPGMDGRAVLDRIRGAKDTAAIPVLISTAFGDEALETELLEAGADDYLEKSGDAKRFMARVRAVLRRAVM